MTAGQPPTCDAENDRLAARRLELDLQDLRFENARLKSSIAERQAEIELLSNRLGIVQAQLRRRSRFKIWHFAQRSLGALRIVLRRR